MLIIILFEEYAKKVILLLFNLKANATAKDLCNELQKAAQNELELRKRKGESGVLAPDDPNHLWINECKKEDLTMDSVLEMLNLANQLLKKQ